MGKGATHVEKLQVFCLTTSLKCGARWGDTKKTIPSPLMGEGGRSSDEGGYKTNPLSPCWSDL